MKAIVALFLLLAYASAENLHRPVELQGSDCINAVFTFGKDVYAVINDIKTLAGGDTSVIPALISDRKTAIAAFQTLESSCGLRVPQVNASCLEDIEAIIMTIRNIGADIGELITGNIDVIGSIVSEAKQLVGYLQEAKSDCLS